MIRAVFFDIGKVLLDFDWFRAYRRAAESCAAGPDEIARWFLSTLHVHDYERGRMTSAEFFELVCRGLGFRGDFEKFNVLWSDIFTEIPESISIARALKGRVSIGLLSNTNDMHIEWIARRFDLLPLFDHCTYSYREGVGKPDPGIYHRALAKASVKPDEALFVDDRAENVAGAQAVGMEAVQFTSPATLRTALSARGLWR
jgi:putative hydrolase of the HAD superfamily